MNRTQDILRGFMPLQAGTHGCDDGYGNGSDGI